MTRARRRKIAKALPPGMHPMTASVALVKVRNDTTRAQLLRRYLRLDAAR